MRVGDTVDDFELPDDEGVPRRLSDFLAKGSVVLFFYPAALSKGCTAEVCHFRDLAAEFDAVGAQPVGISADDVRRQQTFSGRHDLGFPLLSDTEKGVAERFGVKRLIGGLPVKRQTFVIDGDARVVEIVRNEFNMATHADRALEALRAAAA